MARLNRKQRQQFKAMVASIRRDATYAGERWSDDDVAYMVAAIQSDTTTAEMARGLRRTYYGAQTARAHIRFAMDHREAIFGSTSKVTSIRKKA
jgi:hypothetical protein